MSTNTRPRSGKRLAKAQQDAVDTLKHAMQLMQNVQQGPDFKGGNLTWFPKKFDFVNGQLDTMICNAIDDIKSALEAFDDCAEDSVGVFES